MLTGWFKRCTLLLLFRQMPGTFLPLFSFPNKRVKTPPFVPTLMGQYILKNKTAAANSKAARDRLQT
jgi:hypothetical protein